MNYKTIFFNCVMVGCLMLLFVPISHSSSDYDYNKLVITQPPYTDAQCDDGVCQYRIFCAKNGAGVMKNRVAKVSTEIKEVEVLFYANVGDVIRCTQYVLNVVTKLKSGISTLTTITAPQKTKQPSIPAALKLRVK